MDLPHIGSAALGLSRPGFVVSTFLAEGHIGSEWLAVTVATWLNARAHTWGGFAANRETALPRALSS